MEHLNCSFNFQYALDDLNNKDKKTVKINKKGLDNHGFVGAAEELGMIERVSHNNNNNNNSYKSAIEDGPGKKMTLNKPLEVISCSSWLFIIQLKSVGWSYKLFSAFS